MSRDRKTLFAIRIDNDGPRHGLWLTVLLVGLFWLIVIGFAIQYAWCRAFTDKTSLRDCVAPQMHSQEGP